MYINNNSVVGTVDINLMMMMMMTMMIMIMIIQETGEGAEIYGRQQ